MDIFIILNNIYTKNNSKWIDDLEESEIQSFLINNWLFMNDKNINYCKYLDKYVFVLTPKKWLHLAWCVIPKTNKAPFVKYIKKDDNEEKYSELMNKIKNFLEIKGNDLIFFNKYIKYEIEQNLIKYMKYFGMEKKIWKKYGLNFDEMKNEEVKRKIIKGLDLWM